MTTTITPELLYYRFMTPNWIKDNSKAKFNVEASVEDDVCLKIESDSRQYENIFKMGLIAPGVLEKRDDITVRMKVGVILPEPSAPRDPLSFMITDGEHGMGITLMDPNHDYQTSGPYTSIEGNVEGRILDPDNADVATSVRARNSTNPDQFEFNLLPSEYFGTAYCAIDDGHKFVTTYRKQLDLRQGLNLELYRKEKNEEYRINYIEVGVYRNSPAIDPNEA